MSTTEKQDNSDKPKAGILKLRLNVGGSVAALKKDGSQDVEKKAMLPPREETHIKKESNKANTDKVTSGIRRGEWTKDSSTLTPSKSPNLKLSVKVANKENGCDENVSRIKFTVKLKQPNEPVALTVPKIVLSVRGKAEDVKPVTTATGTDTLDVETIEKKLPAKRPRSKTVLPGTSVNLQELMGKKRVGEKQKTPSAPNPYSLIPSSSQTSGAPALGMGKLPIPTYYRPSPSNYSKFPSSSSYSNFNTMTPAEREEERHVRQALSDTFSNLWRSVIKADAERPISSWKEFDERVLPFWLLLSPVDSAYHIPTLKPVNPVVDSESSTVDKVTRIKEDFEKLKARFEMVRLTERNREVPSEVRAMLDRKCLEDDVILYNNLKSKVNLRRNIQMPAASAGNGGGIGRPRILPKNSDKGTWTTGSGIHVVRSIPNAATHTET